MQFKYSALNAAILAVGLSGCGSDEETINHASLSITAVDGYIQQALLCSDINEDGQCSEDEIVKSYNDEYILTNNGFLKTTISLKTQELLTKHPRLITTIQSFNESAPVFTTDKDLPNLVMKPVTLRAPASANVISPITDLISSKMQSGTSLEEAEKSVIYLLSTFSTPDVKLDKTTLYMDYVLAKTDIEKANQKTDLSSNKEYLLLAKLHKLAQVMTETKAMASSPVAFDKFLDNVVQSAQKLVGNLNFNSLLDPTVRPYIPVTEDGIGNVIENRIAQFNAKNMNQLVTKFKSLTEIHGDIALWQDVNVEIDGELVDDPDTINSHNNLIITNEDELAKSNLAATINESLITISRIDSDRDVIGKVHQIKLGSHDLDSTGNFVTGADGTPVVIAAALQLELTVISENYAPVVNIENQKLVQKDIDRLELEQNITINEITVSVADLFADKNNDRISYSAASSLAGIKAKIEATDLIISGKPAAAINDAVITVTATDGDLSTETSFTLPDVTPIHISALRDTFLEPNTTWYRWNSSNDDAQQDYDNRANCMAFTFEQGENLNKGSVKFADGVSCPDEHLSTSTKGTWTVDASGQITINVGSQSWLTGLNDLTAEEYLPRIRTYEVKTNVAFDKTQQAFSLRTINNARGVTLFAGKDSAETYWYSGYGFAFIDNDERAIDASARHGEFTELETGDYLDVDLFVKYRTCEQMGFQPDPDSKNGGYYPTAQVRAAFHLYSEGFSGQSFNAMPYAFKGSDSKGTYCDINLDIRHSVPVKSGQALTIHYSPKDNNTDEEFIINTFIDRDVDILPQANLNITAEGIYLIDGYSVLKFLVDANGDIKKTTATYDGTNWNDETLSSEQLITRYHTTENNNVAYQVWDRDIATNQAESSTLWSDDSDTVKVKDAGKKGVVKNLKSYISENEAKTVVEDKFNTKVVLDNTTWLNTLEVRATIEFTTTHMTYKKEAGVGEGAFNWSGLRATELPSFFPVCMKDESCVVGKFPVIIKYCDEPDMPTWADCQNDKKYTAVWTYQNTNSNEVLTEKTVRYANGHNEHRDWVKQ